MVLVGPVRELPITMPVEHGMPFVKSKEKLLWAGTAKIKTGTAASAGRLVAL
jgi:hypothetical protein